MCKAKLNIIIFVSFTLEEKLVSSKYFIQVHLEILSCSVENIASHLQTKYITWSKSCQSSFTVKYFHYEATITWGLCVGKEFFCSFISSYFKKRLLVKMSTRQSRKVKWDMLNTLFLTLKLSHLFLLLSFSTHKHTSMASLLVTAKDVSAFGPHRKFPPQAGYGLTSYSFKFL